MKKLFLVTAFISMFMLSNAQQDSVLRSKKGKIILPEKHDFCFGISGNTFFDYLGNFFSQAGKNTLSVKLVGGNSLYGKYFLSKNSALRLRAAYSTTKENYINALSNDLDPSGLGVVSDKMDTQNNYFSFALGYEGRHGIGRLQVYGGAELLISQTYINSVYDYGNKMTAFNRSPSTTINFNNGYNQVQRSSSRTLNSKSDYGIGYGARAFFGIEYFIFPKISLGGDFGISANVQNNRKFSNSVESWDFNAQKTQIVNFDATSNSSSSFTDNLNGQIMLLFYFK